MRRISLQVNGKTQVVEADPDCPLLYVLRNDLALHNPRFGCGLGQCGACTVLLENHPIHSCKFPVGRAEGKRIVTLEGLGTPEHPHPLQTAFIEEQGFQCGYCLNGWVMEAKALLERNADPSDEEIREALHRVICRCGSHLQIFAAVRRAAAIMKERV